MYCAIILLVLYYINNTTQSLHGCPRNNFNVEPYSCCLKVFIHYIIMSEKLKELFAYHLTDLSRASRNGKLLPNSINRYFLMWHSGLTLWKDKANGKAYIALHLNSIWGYVTIRECNFRKWCRTRTPHSSRLYLVMGWQAVKRIFACHCEDVDKI